MNAIAIVVIIVLTLVRFAKKLEDKAWNNGACPKCKKGFFVSFDTDSGGAVGYKCTECRNTTWQSWNKRLQPAKI